MKKIVVFGCGGHAKVVADVIHSTSLYIIAAFFDNTPKGPEFLGAPVFSNLHMLADFAKKQGIHNAAIAVGSNSVRKKMAQDARKMGLELPVLTHSTAIISPSAKIEEGTIIMPGAMVNSDAKIEPGCIINSAAVIEHDCTIGEFTHIAPGSVVCGGVKIGNMTLFGARSVAIPMMQIGSHVVLGAGSVIVRNIPDHACAMGNPARIKASGLPKSNS